MYLSVLLVGSPRGPRQSPRSRSANSSSFSGVPRGLRASGFRPGEIPNRYTSEDDGDDAADDVMAVSRRPCRRFFKQRAPLHLCLRCLKDLYS